MCRHTWWVSLHNKIRRRSDVDQIINLRFEPRIVMLVLVLVMLELHLEMVWRNFSVTCCCCWVSWCCCSSCLSCCSRKDNTVEQAKVRIDINNNTTDNILMEMLQMECEPSFTIIEDQYISCPHWVYWVQCNPQFEFLFLMNVSWITADAKYNSPPEARLAVSNYMTLHFVRFLLTRLSSLTSNFLNDHPCLCAH